MAEKRPQNTDRHGTGHETEKNKSPKDARKWAKDTGARTSSS